ncbi:hypothetical protein Cgig2_015589 [Carnegiea gigantea]|uniref:Uncharacterized protein n=1 Tax=Carnegiea gigantea TaxID=171969 RepID=A0A9Q1Q954_9CARY|nr:hypothetical protein Cgig2_015589 [Carnegiea gigantea]
MDEMRPLPPVKTRPLGSAGFPTQAAAQHQGRKSSLGGGEFGTFRKTHHAGVVHQDAARRLAQVIESQNNTTYDEVFYDDDGDLGLELGSLPPLLHGLGNNNGSRRTHRATSPLGHNLVQYTPSVLLISNGQSEATSQPTTAAPEADMPEPALVVNTPVETPILKAGEHRR